MDMTEGQGLSPDAVKVWEFIGSQFAESGSEGAGYALADLAALAGLDVPATEAALKELNSARILLVSFQPVPGFMMVVVELAPLSLAATNAVKEASK